MAAGCGREQAPAAKAPAPPVVRGVTVAAAAPVAWADRVEVPGTVRSRARTTLSSKVVAAVRAVHVHEGSRVAAGQLLVELDDRDLAAQVRRAEAAVAEGEAAAGEVEQARAAATAGRAAAEAQLELADSTLARYRQLLERRSVAPHEFDQVMARQKAAAAEVARAAAELKVLAAKGRQVQARIAAAQAEAGAAEITRGYARINAPTAGVVAAKHAEVGTLAAPGVPLLTLDEAGPYRLEVSVPEQQASGLRLGTRHAVSVEAAGVAGPAPIVEIVPAADPVSRSVLVRLELPASPRLASGQFGRAWFPGPRRQVLALAAGAVVRRGQLTGVYVVGDDRVARYRLVSTGEDRQGAVEILSGLAVDERVVVAGADRVTDGAAIEIGETPGPAAPPPGPPPGAPGRPGGVR